MLKKILQGPGALASAISAMATLRGPREPHEPLGSLHFTRFGSTNSIIVSLEKHKRQLRKRPEKFPRLLSITIALMALASTPKSWRILLSGRIRVRLKSPEDLLTGA